MMGLAVLIEVGHSSELDFAKALRPLAIFGLVHGSHEWFEMFLLIYPQFATDPSHAWIPLFRVCLLTSSFLMLILFGVRLISGPTRPVLVWGMMLTVTAIWGFGLLGLLLSPIPSAERMISADVYTRYALAIPGAALTVWGLLLQRRKFNQEGMRALQARYAGRCNSIRRLWRHRPAFRFFQHPVSIGLSERRAFPKMVWLSCTGLTRRHGYS